VKPTATCLEDGFPVIGLTYICYIAVQDLICFYLFKKFSKCLVTSSWYFKNSKSVKETFIIYHEDVPVPSVSYRHLIGTTLCQLIYTLPEAEEQHPADYPDGF